MGKAERRARRRKLENRPAVEKCLRCGILFPTAGRLDFALLCGTCITKRGPGPKPARRQKVKPRATPIHVVSGGAPGLGKRA